MSLMDYVIGGMDPSFRVTLYHALRALDDAGLMPGIRAHFATIIGKPLRLARRLKATGHIMVEASAAALVTGERPIS
jgi:hypothetical protein